MLPHGHAELVLLASHCEAAPSFSASGWIIDAWTMSEPAVDAAVEVYRAILLGDRSTEARNLLAEQGIDLDALLMGDSSKDDITRSDVTELIAAASVAARNSWDPQLFHMPNVPKMARKKSDSGIDVMGVKLDANGGPVLGAGERLLFVSVKHSVSETTQGLRSKLALSVSDTDLTPAYVAQQLRVLKGRLQSEGVPENVADRVWQFIQHIWDEEKVDHVAVGVADILVKTDFDHHIGLLPATSTAKHFRAVHVPGLRELASRCP